MGVSVKKSDVSLFLFYISISVFISTSIGTLLISLMILINPNLLDVLINHTEILLMGFIVLSIIVVAILFYQDKKQCFD